ncbi:MAG: FG-GAP repeat protein [Flavobacteriales bacterium]|nr:FG-GAP repeat protein [Flavobacteriales bacterium]
MLLLFWVAAAAQPSIVFEQPINASGIADLNAGDWFGYDMAPIGDLNGDGVNDIAVGAIYDGDGGMTRGAVYILFMTSAGTVGSYQKISDTQGGFQGVLVDEAFFGSSITNLGDINGDGVQDLAVGATGDDDGGSWAGSVWILFMNTDGTVNGEQKISALSGSFNAGLEAVDRFGVGLDSIGD